MSRFELFKNNSLLVMKLQIWSFRTLTQADQIILLKSSTIEMFIVRSVFSLVRYDRQHRKHLHQPSHLSELHHFTSASATFDSSYDMIANMESSHLGDVLLDVGLFEDQARFSNSLVYDLMVDEVTLVLLMVISLFSPDKYDLIRREHVAFHQEHFTFILRRYISSRFPPELEKSIFPKLLLKLSEIRNLNHDYFTVLATVHPDYVTPVMKELLNINQFIF